MEDAGAQGSTMKRMLVSTANQLTSGSRFVYSSAPNCVLRIDNVAFTMDDPEYIAYGYAGAGNELTKVWNENGPVGLAYDAAGRIITKTTSNPSYAASYAWRYGGKLFQTVNTIPAELTIATYAYRGDGKLFQETYGFGSPYKRFHWDGWRLIGEEDNTGTLQRSYVQQPGVPFGATLAEAPGSNQGAADYRYFGRDAHGSTRATFAQDKARTGTADWHPYGIQRQGFGLSRCGRVSDPATLATGMTLALLAPLWPVCDRATLTTGDILCATSSFFS